MSVDVIFPGIPLPEQVGAAPPIAANDAELVWESGTDPRLARYLDGLELPPGRLSVRVDQIDDGPPRLDVDESYSLVTHKDGVNLHASTTWGAIHGVSTLRQLCSMHDLCASGLQIDDSPRFAWRGLLVDVARHFIPLDVLFRVVDGMALLKLNVLHLHLTDDQGFRFPSKAFPELASEDVYGREDLASLLAFAADRGIRIIPELDVPGHVQSWLVKYPEWGLAKVGPTRRFGVHKPCLDPTNETVYQALAVLFKEVADVFPDEYVHIGGDEVHPDWWSENADVQAFIEERNLGDIRGLQALFNRRMHQILAELGKRAVGWDEVLHPEMPEMTVQNWRGATTRDRALARGLDCIVSAGYYLDLFYPAGVHYQYDIGLPQADLLQQEDELQAELRFAHVAPGMAWTNQWREEAIEAGTLSGRILGGEACLWSELVDGATLETRLFSRLPAVAERLWSAGSPRDLEGFYRRLRSVLELSPFTVAQRQSTQLQALGLTRSQVEMLSYLEPIKWYGRLLGEVALAARIAGREMPQARPYDCDTPLDRVVDYISPESLAAMALEHANAGELHELANIWVDAAQLDWPQDVVEAMRALAQVGQLLKRYLDAAEDVRAELHALYVPHGEYMVAAIPPLLARLGRS